MAVFGLQVSSVSVEALGAPRPGVVTLAAGGLCRTLARYPYQITVIATKLM